MRVCWYTGYPGRGGEPAVQPDREAVADLLALYPLQYCRGRHHYREQVSALQPYLLFAALAPADHFGEV